MNTKHLISATVAAGVIAAVAYFLDDNAFKGVQAATSPDATFTPHKFDHGKVDYPVQAASNSPSTSVGANDD